MHSTRSVLSFWLWIRCGQLLQGLAALTDLDYELKWPLPLLIALVKVFFKSQQEEKKARHSPLQAGLLRRLWS